MREDGAYIIPLVIRIITFSRPLLPFGGGSCFLCSIKLKKSINMIDIHDYDIALIEENG